VLKFLRISSNTNKHIGCVPIFTASTENLQCTSRILQICSTGNEYRNIQDRNDPALRPLLPTALRPSVYTRSLAHLSDRVPSMHNLAKKHSARGSLSSTRNNDSRRDKRKFWDKRNVQNVIERQWRSFRERDSLSNTVARAAIRARKFTRSARSFRVLNEVWSVYSPVENSKRDETSLES